MPPVYSYIYDMQPLIYYVVACLRHVLPMTCEEIFCLLTAAAAAAAVAACISLIYRLTGLRREWILLALFLLPESAAIGMYPNTAVFAMLPFTAALVCLLRRETKTAAALLCLAPLFRIDVLMVYPVVFFIFLWQGDTPRAAFRKSALMALTVAAATALCYWLLRAEPFEMKEGYEKWNGRITVFQNLITIFSFYTAAGIPLFLGGLLLILKRKDYRLSLVVAAPVLLNQIVYGQMANAAKHYLYTLPFVALAVAAALAALAGWLKTRRALKYAAIGTLAVYLLVSLRISAPGRPWLSMPNAEANTGPRLTLFQENRSPLKLSAGIGAGFLLKTNDEYMLASGNLFYPFFIRRLKERRTAAREKAYGRLASLKGYTLLGADWGERIYQTMLLLEDGYSFEEESSQFILRSPDGGKKVVVKLAQRDSALGDDSARRELLKTYIRSLTAADTPCYLFTCNDSQVFFFDQFADEGLVEKITEGLYLIHTPRTAGAGRAEPQGKAPSTSL